jgi:hypothetical protein
LKEENKLATLEEGVEGTAVCLEAAAYAATDAGAAEDEAAAVTTKADEHTHAVSLVMDAATDADAAVTNDAAGTHQTRKSALSSRVGGDDTYKYYVSVLILFKFNFFISEIY